MQRLVAHNGRLKMNRTELCAWLRANSSGIYRPAADAAAEIERLEDALCEIANADMTTKGFQMIASEALQGGPAEFGAA
jgi:hypothetical protein